MASLIKIKLIHFSQILTKEVKKTEELKGIRVLQRIRINRMYVYMKGDISFKLMA